MSARATRYTDRSLQRRILALAALLAIVALRIEPQLLQMPFVNHRILSIILTRWPETQMPGDWLRFPRFLEEVRARTKDGDKIAVIIPAMKWDDGYSYAYYRSSYFLAGREVLPLLDADGRSHMENFYGAQYVIVWHRPVHPRMGKVVWEGEGGALVKR
jgi:hypothetical protein